MKILIGTPINEIKDYCMERWLGNVAKLIAVTPADLFLVDNSSSADYVEKLAEYCTKYQIKDYQIEHFEVTNVHLEPDKLRSVNVEISQELIRQKALKDNYDAWFSWECDQIIPTDSLERLIELMSFGSYMMVAVNSWARNLPEELNTNMGVTLITKVALEMGWFLPMKKGKISYDLADFYNVDETMFKKRVLKNGGNYAEIYGVIEPILHLDK